METALLKSGYAIRPLSAGDIAHVLALVDRNPGAARWSCADYEQVCGHGPDGWVATAQSAVGRDDGCCVVGFLVARRIADEMEILNLAVDVGFRRRGVASRLLEAALKLGSASGMQRVFLEVRASNAGAIAFYERQGFRQVGRRPRYYSDPPEDALVLFRTVL